jgi:hypothetical protein
MLATGTPWTKQVRSGQTLLKANTFVIQRTKSCWCVSAFRGSAPHQMGQVTKLKHITHSQQEPLGAVTPSGLATTDSDIQHLATWLPLVEHGLQPWLWLWLHRHRQQYDRRCCCSTLPQCTLMPLAVLQLHLLSECGCTHDPVPTTLNTAPLPATAAPAGVPLSQPLSSVKFTLLGVQLLLHACHAALAPASSSTLST